MRPAAHWMRLTLWSCCDAASVDLNREQRQGGSRWRQAPSPSQKSPELNEPPTPLDQFSTTGTIFANQISWGAGGGGGGVALSTLQRAPNSSVTRTEQKLRIVKTATVATLWHFTLQFGTYTF